MSTSQKFELLINRKTTSSPEDFELRDSIVVNYGTYSRLPNDQLLNIWLNMKKNCSTKSGNVTQ